MGTRNDIKHLKWCNDNRLREIFELERRLSALEAKAGEGKQPEPGVYVCRGRCYMNAVEAVNPHSGYVVPLEDVPVGRWFLLNRAAGCKVYGKRTSVDNASSVIYFVRPDGTPDSCGRCVKVELMPEGYEPLASTPQPGEGKGCACKCKCRCQTATGEMTINGKVVGTASITFTVDPIPDRVFELRRKPKPAPQPGDRIKLRDVPVGRWCVPNWRTPCKCIGNDGTTQTMQSDGGGIWYANRNHSGIEPVTLLPEDYEPGRKRVVREFRVQRMSDGTVQLLDNDGKVVDRCHETDMVVIKPDAWSKDQ